MRRVLIPETPQSLPTQLPAGEISTLYGQTMGTTWFVRYLNAKPQSFRQQSEGEIRLLIQHELDLVVAQMSTWHEDSNLSKFNRAEANTWHALPAPFFAVLECALRVAADTGGAFDPTIGPLVNGWGFGPDGQRTFPLEATEVKVLHARCGWQKLQLDEVGLRVLQPGGLYVDFSGIAKGYSVDRIARALQAAGLESFLIEVGGELYGAGIKQDGQPWWVSLEAPPNLTSLAESVIALHGLAVASSGNYRRYFEHAGQRYAHTIDPRSGFPIDLTSNPVVSVTVLHAECMMADVLATAFTVMGVDAALAYAEKNEIAVLLVEQQADNFKEHFSPQLIAMMI